jgi:hypothetical protein
MLACEGSNAESAIKLVELGSEKDLVNKEGKNALAMLPEKQGASTSFLRQGKIQ